MPNFEEVKDWVREHASVVLLGGSGALLVLGLLAACSSMTGGQSQASVNRQAGQLVSNLHGQVKDQQASLVKKHTDMLAGLPGLDSARVSRDQAAGRSILLAVTGSAASSRTVSATQKELIGRYGFFSKTSQAVTSFVPDWMATAGAGKGRGITYRLASTDIQASGVKGLDYSYIGTAHLVPAGSVRSGSDQYVVFTYGTHSDGSVTWFGIDLVSPRSRDALSKVTTSTTRHTNQASGAASSSPRTTRSSGG